MTLYLVRHGRAKDEQEDPERPLTDRGVDEVTRVARHAVDRFGVSAALVLHSGKARARQTAEIWGGLLDARVTEASGLAPNDEVSTWVERLGREADDLVVVGHLPHLARLSSSLVTGNQDELVVPFRAGGVVVLERTDEGWTFSAALPPELA